MIEDIIWTSRATDDFLNINTSLSSVEEIEHFLALVKIFPGIGRKVEWTDNIQRGLIGKKRVYGLYYSIHGKRLFVIALINLRQDSKTIESLIKSRLPGS
jgi:hypothetical protein